MRDKYPLAISATVIVVSFGMVIMFITYGYFESNTSSEEDVRELEYFVDNATKAFKTTQIKTKQEIVELLNETKVRIQESESFQNFNQLFEKVETNSTTDVNFTNNKTLEN